MSVPMMAIVVLCVSGFILTLIRSTMGREPAYVRGNGGGCGSGACKTIGSRQVQEDEYGVVESEDGTMAVLADGMGKQYGGKIASRIAVESFQDLFQDANAFYNPQYYFRKAFHRANQEILNQLDDGRGSASVAAVLLKKQKIIFCLRWKCEDSGLSKRRLNSGDIRPHHPGPCKAEVHGRKTDEKRSCHNVT
ncbi:PP2C family protein-serine/threonine phosphatase [Hungatella hathewayi]|uniref:PPM-type phosphatase domain-containing protein n=1 Tax=Hungatella hathewayi WAL-18680 TaxID=742737 RepID=G5IN02_9FIRM|nr:protein phosphatase 2C domain-containing protein [Hungatella hathewayi]EHI56973.1 hypothetical protein HMPREF9473_04880 [ [Hungatella hathewayi WAL-18680]